MWVTHLSHTAMACRGGEGGSRRLDVTTPRRRPVIMVMAESSGRASNYILYPVSATVKLHVIVVPLLKDTL